MPRHHKRARSWFLPDTNIVNDGGSVAIDLLGEIEITSGAGQPVDIIAKAASLWTVMAGGLIVNTTSADLVFQTTTSGNIRLAPAGGSAVSIASQILLPDGSQLNPSLAFTSNNVSGIWWSGSGLFLGFNNQGNNLVVDPLGTTVNGRLTLNDGANIVIGSSVGTIIATAVTQKLGIYGATPIAQRSGAAQAAVPTTGSTNVAPFGFSSASQGDAIVALVNELRAWAVAQGWIKGSA